MKERLLYLLKFYLLTVVLFVIAKWFFFYYNDIKNSYSCGDMVDVMLHGLSLDLSTALYFLIVPYIVSFISICYYVPKWIMMLYHGFIAVVFSLAFVADTSLYPFWRFKLDVSCLQYLTSPTEAMASVPDYYLMERLGLLVVAIALIFILYHIIAPAWELNGGRRKEFLYELLLIPVFVIGIRGGVSESTTNIGQVYFSKSQFLNHAAVNPIFSFMYSLGHQLEDLSQYQFYVESECKKITAGVYTTTSENSELLLNNKKPNILIILLESAGEQFADAMPHLQQYKREGVYFSQCYANSWRTDRGTLSALSGYPSFPSFSVMKMPEKTKSLPGIATNLRYHGYETSYLYGGDINFTNMRSYLLSTGWSQLTSMDDYSLSERHTAKWGVRDDITFKTVYQNIMEADNCLHYLWGYSTLSSHEPWDVPTKKLDDEVKNAFSYLDDCLYEFVEKLKKTPKWDNLLIVLLADHGIVYGDIDQTKPMQKNHIPMLWLGGAVKQPKVINTLCNQSDLPATLLGQLHMFHDEFAFSRDVLSKTYTHPVAVHNYNNAQWICDSTGHVLYDFDLKRLTIKESRDAKQLERLNKAIMQLTTTDLQNR